MKKILFGGFLSVAGSIWALAVIIFSGNTSISGWSTPPGKLISFISAADAMPLFVIATMLVVVGMLFMVYGLIQKD